MVSTRQFLQILKTEKSILDKNYNRSCVRFARLNSVLHDSYELIYNSHTINRGYCYSIKYAPRCLRKSSSIGKTSGAT